MAERERDARHNTHTRSLAEWLHKLYGWQAVFTRRFPIYHNHTTCCTHKLAAESVASSIIWLCCWLTREMHVEKQHYICKSPSDDAMQFAAPIMGHVERTRRHVQRAGDAIRAFNWGKWCMRLALINYCPLHHWFWFDAIRDWNMALRDLLSKNVMDYYDVGSTFSGMNKRGYFLMIMCLPRLRQVDWHQIN